MDASDDGQGLRHQREHGGWIWRAHGFQPHMIKQLNDPKFVEKLRDVVGLYVDLSAHAIALSFDEKSRVQALDRTQRGCQ